MAAKEISDIVSDLMKVGALIPESETKCSFAHDYMLDSVVVASTIVPTRREEVKRLDIAKIDGLRQLINSLKEQDYIPSKDAATMEFHLTAAVDYLEQDNWPPAADMLQRYSTFVGQNLPIWHGNCACVKKGDIISGIYYGIDIYKEVDPTHKNLIWQAQIVALNRDGILTSEEADRLVKEVRW